MHITSLLVRRKKSIIGSVSIGCNCASCGIIGLYIDNLRNGPSLLIWSLMIIGSTAILVTVNQMGLAKKAFIDYCDWHRFFHYATIVLPPLLIGVLGTFNFYSKIFDRTTALQIIIKDMDNKFSIWELAKGMFTVCLIGSLSLDNFFFVCK